MSKQELNKMTFQDAVGYHLDMHNIEYSKEALGKVSEAAFNMLGEVLRNMPIGKKEDVDV